MRTPSGCVCLADSDAYLYAMGPRLPGPGTERHGPLPEGYPVQVQGPKAKT